MAREWEMALDINSVLDSGVSGDEALGSLGNFKRCILRSRRHGADANSCRLFLRNLCSWRADSPSAAFAAP